MEANKTLTLNGKTFEIVRVGEHATVLRGRRGSEWLMVQNKHNPDRWTLVDSSGRIHEVE